MVQKIPGPNLARFMYNGVIFWQRSAVQGGSLLFNVYKNSPIYAFAFNGNGFNPNPVSSSLDSGAANAGFNSSMALSANADYTGTGIIWELQNNPATNISVLRALDASNLGNELWNSSVYLSDSLKSPTTYIPPTISNGKVYAPTLRNQLVVYGLRQNYPYVTPVANQNSALFSSINLGINASTASGDVLVYSATGLPTGLSINSSTGAITGTPKYIGSYSVQVNVLDSTIGHKNTIQFTWIISRGLIK